MLDPVTPDSFRDRPYARQYYAQIAAWAAQNHPFYMKRVQGPNPDFPVITRTDVQEDNETLLNGCKCTGRTSGSTSMPVEVSWSVARSELERRDNADFVRMLGGRLASARIVALSSHGKSDISIDVTEPLPAQVEFILRLHAERGAAAVITYPSNLEMLCRYVIDHDIDMGFVRRLVSLSEVYEPVVDELAARAFPNAVSTYTYSSVEVGLIAVRCPHNPHNLHIRAKKLGVEFLDAQGRPCRDGELGQVVVTDYSNRNSSIIRYALGDLAAPTVCDCPIGMPAMTNLVGKVRGVLKHADGRPVLFTGLSPMLRDCPEILQFQVIQPAIGHFIVKFVPKQGMALDDFHARVRSHFEADFGAGIRMDFEPCGEIPRSAGGKFHGAICLA
jgi:phenylacetate-coenzyme A ligase PaaK-like adenylate-forming protein